MAQDASELDFNDQEAEDLDPLNYGARYGMYVHPTYAVMAQREPPGVLYPLMWTPEKGDKDGVHAAGAERKHELAREL